MTGKGTGTENGTGIENVNDQERESETERESVTTVPAWELIIVKKSDTGTKSTARDQRGATNGTGRELAGRRRNGTERGGIEKKKSPRDINHQEAAAGAAMTVKKVTVIEDTNTRNPNVVKKAKTQEASLPQSQRVLRHLPTNPAEQTPSAETTIHFTKTDSQDRMSLLEFFRLL